MNKCMEKGHKYQKFDDASLFCERCGERKVITYAPTYWPDWTYRPPTWWPNPWNPPYIVTSGTITVDDTTTRLSDNVTYTSGTVQTNAIAGPQTATPRGVRRT